MANIQQLVEKAGGKVMVHYDRSLVVVVIHKCNKVLNNKYIYNNNSSLMTTSIGTVRIMQFMYLIGNYGDLGSSCVCIERTKAGL